jgi:hypothetical protein
MGTTLGDTGGQREYIPINLGTLMYTHKKRLFLYFGHQLLLIGERCEALTIVYLVVFELYVVFIANKTETLYLVFVMNNDTIVLQMVLLDI